MRFQTPLLRATLLRRYKRFLADIVLQDGREVTAHCANPGKMTGLAEVGTIIWAQPNDDPKRKLRYAWKLVELPGGHMACVDTGAANRVVQEALEAGDIPALTGYDTIRPEQRYGTGSRIDFLLGGGGLPECYVEVKSVTLSRAAGLAEFLDTVTARGARHLAELTEIAKNGERAVLLYLVQRSDCDRVTVASDIDPAYARAMLAARAAGVEVLAYRADITPMRITLGPALRVE
ncbi:sugar fermentation stimulation protein A [Roseovarius nanhaiticus]|uniref:Sugar fermentation stimulation protein homolog n=1 Tax=Roseovarius nanhaiticus TaxID=573024 RepID=A0A1N7HCC2_9RHOB|nr:DNA/RNA nuclease SfsA [Roseovarius nanhaiticus]SEL03350.1 sugar fermentation stimulation protein A [Roseovarius nanhaiticus]SIS22413.1 sugar fermentation stimulation protein A [Roseovarius nanhaiticus]